MAKIGNFVGKGWMPIRKREASRIAAFLQKQCEQVFGENYFERFETVIDNQAWDYSTTGKRYAHIRKMVVYAYVKYPIPEYRGGKGGRIKRHTRVEFTIHKQSGYLEVRNPKTGERERDYENCPPFDYSGYVRGDGRVTGYGCRGEEIMEPQYHYVYGTEIRDLDFTSALYDLESVTRVEGVRREYAKLLELRKAA